MDIRDGQLRIGKEASFRVYLLNTMDRDIAEIALRVQSEEFNADVTQSPQWHSYPVLRAVKSKGKKQYFTVTLKRKPGVPDGKYKIKLDISSVKEHRSFKVVDLNSAAGICTIPKSVFITVDGRPEEKEWAKTYLCTNFTSYKKAGQYMENHPARDASRCRVSADAENIYLLLQLQGGAGAQADQISLYAAGSHERKDAQKDAQDVKPVVVTFDRKTGKVACDKGIEGIEYKTSANGEIIECKIPRALLGVKDAQNIYMNFTRTVTRENKKEVTYWRGNAYSVQDPMVYGQFRIAK